MQDPRIWRSPYSNFYEDETLHADEVYTTSVLKEIGKAGFNAIWIRGILRDLAPTKIFPEFGRDSAMRVRSLRTVMRRGKRAGVKVILYMQPPLGMAANDPFWQKHPDLRGATHNARISTRIFPRSALCTSTPTVCEFLRAATRNLARSLPDLGGIILITASEYVQHCYSHVNIFDPKALKRNGRPRVDCPRCADRDPGGIVVDIVRDVRTGLRSAGSDMPLIAWNWSWSYYEADPQARIIRALPNDVMVMAGFERGATKTILGKKRQIDEYSLSYAGPSPRFLNSLKAGRRSGHKVMTKLQFGTTHELATVPNLPLIGSLYDKARAMRKLRVKGFMGCWNFGNMLTANTAAFLHFLDVRRLPPRKPAMEQFARAYFPGCDSAKVVAAWEQFVRSMNHYPFCIPFLYWSPTNYAVARPIEPSPLDCKPVGRSWMPDRRGDGLDETYGVFTHREVTEGLEQLSRIWDKGVRLFEQGTHDCTCAHAAEEMNTVRVAASCFHSTWNLYRAYPIRKNWQPANIKCLRPIMEDELAHLVHIVPILKVDKRMGYHSECQHFQFTHGMVQRKIRRLKKLLQVCPAH